MTNHVIYSTMLPGRRTLYAYSFTLMVAGLELRLTDWSQDKWTSSTGNFKTQETP